MLTICPHCHAGCPPQEVACPGCGQGLEGLPEVSGQNLVGMVIDRRYRLDGPIGEGAMGWVYRGTHLLLQSAVAVKIMKPVRGDAARIARFEHEARAASRIQHPHVLMIHDFGRTAGGLSYIVSELVQGETLGEILKQEGALPLGRVATLFRQVLAAVEEAHSHQLIHRDLKPDNIMVTRLRSGEDFVKVLDFGIAVIAEAPEARLTVQGELCGTPAFMAPERIRGKEATPQSDIYSLALILYELLTGRAPFEVTSVMEMLAMHLHSQPRPLGEVAPHLHIPPGLEAVVQRGLSKLPAERFSSINELRSALFQAIGSLEDVPLPCRGCHLPRPSWSSHCVSCGIAGGALGPMDSLGAAPKPIWAPRHDVAGSGARPEVEQYTQVPQVPWDRPDWKPPEVPPEPWASSGLSVLIGRLSDASSLETLDPAPALGDKEEWWVGPGASSSGHTSALARTVSSSAGALVGREKELRTLQAFLEGTRGVLELLGPSGMGKTRLLRHLAQRATERGMTVIWAGEDPSQARAPFFAVRVLGAARLGLATESLDLTGLRRAVVRLGLSPEDIPGLADLFGLHRSAGDVSPMVRLRECHSASLRVLVGPPPPAGTMLYIVDDSDRLDGPSIDFLRRLAELTEGGSIKLILASEASVLPPDGPQESLFLGPLSDASVEALGQAGLAGRELPALSLSDLVSFAEGSPLRATQAMGLLAGGGALPDRGVGSGGAPGLEEILEARFAGLDVTSQRVLGALSLLGPVTQQELLLSVLGWEGAEKVAPLEVALDRLVSERLVEREPAGMAHGLYLPEGTLLVAHGQITSFLLQRMPNEDRIAGHRLAYEFLKNRGAPLPLLARHAAHARLGEKTLEVLERAGDWARQWLDAEGAAIYYRGALHVARWEVLLGEEDEARQRLAWKLGEVLTSTGHFLAAEMTFKETLASQGVTPLYRGRLLLAYARLLFTRGIHDEALAQSREALKVGLEEGSPELLLEIYLELAEAYLALGQREAAVAELDEALLVLTAGEGPEATDVPQGFWRVLLRLAELRYPAGLRASIDGRAGGIGTGTGTGGAFQAEAAALAAQALGHARRVGAIQGEAASLLALVRYSLSADRRSGVLPDLIGHLSDALAAHQKLGDRRGVAECLLLKARVLPDRDARTTLAEKALVLASEVRWPEGMAEARLLLHDAA